MNNYSLLFLTVFLASCTTTSTPTSNTKVAAPVSNSDLRTTDTGPLSIGLIALSEGIDKIGKDADLATTYAAGKKELGPNPYPDSKHYHGEINVEHSHGNPGYKHDPMAMSAATSHLYYFDHFHGKQAPHNHFVPLSLRHNHRK